MGRPTKFTAEVGERIVNALRAGNYLETAAAHAGIHRDTLHDWLRKGASAEGGPLRAFSDAVAKALADAEVRDVAIISKAATEQWQAAAWKLERKYPDKWGRRVQVQGDAEKPVAVTVKAEDAVVELARLLAERTRR